MKCSSRDIKTVFLTNTAYMPPPPLTYRKRIDFKTLLRWPDWSLCCAHVIVKNGERNSTARFFSGYELYLFWLWQVSPGERCTRKCSPRRLVFMLTTTFPDSVLSWLYVHYSISGVVHMASSVWTLSMCLGNHI
ncbi:hypothetical protein M404DRAFT_519209 [Pisolithus tinctorius Marx 270]|uniref:Uncharacterized protein n=1 Tax=Pisolithus tinctorius Marx 270 TaxID=870435 RepID=A0A0C3PC46_PISTI|nr:hypothetical protein M404DRAFT_519209 [Pisolithus tinctorius Marx 270]